MFPVSPRKLNALRSRMLRLGVREVDLQEDFVRGTGAGGQKINKTSVAVLLTHRPTGIQIRCQEGRSQGFNRFEARRRLLDKLEERIQGEKSLKRQKIEKIRRQKRRRSRRAKEKILADKKKTSEKKLFRQRPRPED